MCKVSVFTVANSSGFHSSNNNEIQGVYAIFARKLQFKEVFITFYLQKSYNGLVGYIFQIYKKKKSYLKNVPFVNMCSRIDNSIAPVDRDATDYNACPMRWSCPNVLS